MRLERTAATDAPWGHTYLAQAGGRFLGYRNAEAAIAYDAGLRELARFPLPPDAVGAHALRADLRVAAISCIDRIVLIDTVGQVVFEFAHVPWGFAGSESGATMFAADGRLLWATVPAVHGSDRGIGIDLDAAIVREEYILGCHAAGATFLPADDQAFALVVGEGQDGARNYLFEHGASGHRTCREILDSESLLVFADAGGARLASIPFGPEARSLTLHSSAGTIATIVAIPLAEEAELDGVAGRIDDTRLVLGVLGGEPAIVVVEDDPDPMVHLVKWPDGQRRRLRAVSGQALLATSASGELETWRLHD